MPTKSRSSYTDPRDVFIRLNPLGLGEAELRKDSTGFEDQRTHSDYLLFLAGYRETHPEPQPHPEPIAWMVGTAFWWTKEEAERDAAATGLPVVPVGQMVAQHGEPVWFMTEGGVSALHAKAKAMSDQQGLDTSSYCVPLYTHADSGEVERLRADLEGLSNDFDRSQHELGERTTERNTLRAQLADRDTLIDEVLKAFQLNADGNGSCHNPGLSFIRPWAERVAALSASADPSVPAERDEPVCKGDWQLGTACGKCRRCKGNSPA